MPTQTQSVDKIETTNAGILIFTADVTQIILDGVLVSSRDQSGLYSAGSNTIVLNSGNVHSASFIGIYLVSGGRVDNLADGLVVGKQTGIAVDNAPTTVNNYGIAYGFGLSGVGVGLWADAVLNNHGEIYGRAAGATIATSRGSGAVINNFARISSDDTGVVLGKVAGDFGTINNKASGVIRGDDRGIYANGGKLTLNNFGTIVGLVESDTANQRDVIVNHGKIQGLVRLGPGNDLFNGNGGTSGGVFGEEGNDRLIGSATANRLVGGLNKDTMTGAAGADQFRFTNVADSVVGANRDLITDFHHAQHDRINLAAIDAKAGGTPNDAFAFRGTLAFTGPGQLRYAKIDPPGTANDKTIISGNIDGDFAPEFQIELKGIINLVASDFVL